MQINNFDQLIEIFQKENVPFRGDRDNQLIELAVNTGPLQTEMVIRWEAQLVLAQFIVAFPFRVQSERIAAVEHALSILNHRLIMPGFGLDNDKGILYFRLVTPRQDDGSMTYDQVHRLISAAVDTLLDFYPLLVGVVNEGKAADELLDALAPSLAKLPERNEAAAPPAQAAATPAAAANAPGAETIAHGAETPAQVAAEPIEAAGTTTKATGATTQEPEAAAKAAEVITESPVTHPQTPAIAPQAAEAPAASSAAPADHSEKSPA